MCCYEIQKGYSGCWSHWHLRIHLAWEEHESLFCFDFAENSFWVNNSAKIKPVDRGLRTPNLAIVVQTWWSVHSEHKSSCCARSSFIQWVHSVQTPLFTRYRSVYSLEHCSINIGYVGLSLSVLQHPRLPLRERARVTLLSTTVSASISQFMLLALLRLCQLCPSKHRLKAEKEVRSQHETKQEILSVLPWGA